MKNMKKMLTLLLAVALCLSVFTACTKEKAPAVSPTVSTSESTEPEAQVEPTTEEATEGVVGYEEAESEDE